jgi:hypothetical protein
MIKSIGVIGLGSIGSFLVEHLSEHENINRIVLVDFDIVELKNIGNSAYDFEHIGELKVDALAKIVDDNVNVIKRVSKYIEGKTWIPKCDIIIDCRDFVYNRSGFIDMRVHISGKTLIVDCRKQFISNENYQGIYSITLQKHQIKEAAHLVFQLIIDNNLPNILKNELVYKTHLDNHLLKTSIQNCIDNKCKNRRDIVYDLNKDSDRLQCVDEYIYPILESNKTLDIPVYVDTLKDEPDYMFPKGLLREPVDVIELLLPIIRSNSANYLISLEEERNGAKYIHLLKETGAA